MGDEGFDPNLDFASWSAEGGLFVAGMVGGPETLLFKGLTALRGGARVLPFALRGGKATTHVYFGVRNGERVYVGITNNIARRQAEHGGRFVLKQITESPVTRGEARAIEQAIINRNPGFENVRNSISPNHSWYGEAVEWGEAWLKANGL